jgi:SnoaL-like domain
MSAIEVAIARQEAILAICEVKARYCRMLDGKDWAGFSALFTEDFELDTSGAGGPVVRGREAAMKMVRGSVETARTAHQVHSPEIALHGDSADVIWAMQDRVIWGPERKLAPGLLGHTGYGHYHEHYVRQDGNWRIARQRLVHMLVDNHYAPRP